MCEKNFAFLCCEFFLLVTSSSKSQQNSINNEVRDNLTIQYKVDTNSTTIYSDEIKMLQYDLYKKCSNNTRYKMQYVNKFQKNNNCDDNDSILYKLDTYSKHNHEDDEQISMKFYLSLTNINHKRLQEIYRNLTKKNNFMSNEVFENSSKDGNKSNICILLCCRLDHHLDNECIPDEYIYVFSNVYGYTNDSLHIENKKLDLFQLNVYDSCLEKNYSMPSDYMIFVNGSIYLSFYKIFVKSILYCLAVENFEVIICSETLDEINKKIFQNDNAFSNSDAILHASLHIVAILFLVPIFIVYTILPELRNVHGFMLSNYSGALSVAYVLHIVPIIIKKNDIPPFFCTTIAFFEYFCFLSGYFWLTTISFDMWRTFREPFLLQRNVRQEKRKLYYAIYAWGCPFILAIVSVIMDFVSNITILKPKFLCGNCWFYDKEALALYFYGFKSVCIISSISLSIFTALSIKRYEKDTGRRLTNSEIKQYNNNKKWLNLYLKLFIVLFVMMGIKWFATIIWWLPSEVLEEPIKNKVRDITNLVVILQNVCTFIIFLCKKRIKVLLLKRLGCGLFLQGQSEMNATLSIYTTTSMQGSMREKTNSCAQEIAQRAKDSSDETEL